MAPKHIQFKMVHIVSLQLLKRSTNPLSEAFLETLALSWFSLMAQFRIQFECLSLLGFAKWVTKLRRRARHSGPCSAELTVHLPELKMRRRMGGPTPHGGLVDEIGARHDDQRALPHLHIG